jgi:hypothetical protein
MMGHGYTGMKYQDIHRVFLKDSKVIECVSWLPRRCAISGTNLWLKSACRETKTMVGYPIGVFWEVTQWYDKTELALFKLQHGD